MPLKSHSPALCYFLFSPLGGRQRVKALRTLGLVENAGEGPHCGTETPTFKGRSLSEPMGKSRDPLAAEPEKEETRDVTGYKMTPTPPYVPPTPQGSPMGSCLHRGLKHSDSKGEKIINHGKPCPRRCAEVPGKSQVCRRAGQAPWRMRGQPRRISRQLDSLPRSSIEGNEILRLPHLSMMQ